MGNNFLVVQPVVALVFRNGVRSFQQQVRRAGPEGFRVFSNLNGIDELSGLQVKKEAGGIPVWVCAAGITGVVNPDADPRRAALAVVSS